MRYYDLIISNPTTNAIIRRWTSHPNGVSQAPDTGALNIEFDVMVANLGPAESPGGSVVTVEGIALTDLFQAQQFVGMNVMLKGGMGKGLPLANPDQSGVLLVGQVFQAFGNWVGTEMTLDLVVIGVDPYSLDAPGNFTVNWPGGLPMNAAIGQVLTQAYPGVKQNFNIQPGIVFPNAEYGAFSTLRQFAAFVLALTQGYGTPSYPGISITIQGGQFFIYDNTPGRVAVPFAFNDFVGQPTWIGAGQMQVSTVLRADIQVGNQVQMPKGLHGAPGITTSFYNPASPQPPQYQSGFQGQFQVYGIRHVGCFRDPNGRNWVTIFNCVENG